jgi:hypothetical protein
MDDGTYTIGMVDFLEIQAYQKTEIEEPEDPRQKPKVAVERALWILDTRVDPPYRVVMNGWDWEFVEELILDPLVQHGYTGQWLRVSRVIRTFLKHELGEDFRNTGYSEAVTIRESAQQ